MEPQTDPNAPLSDDYLKAHGNDPDIAQYLSSDERRRLTRLRVDAVQAAKAAGHPTMGAPTGREPVTLGDLVADTKPGRTAAHEITLFDGTGVGIQDVAAAVRAYTLARMRNAGRSLSLA